MPFTIPDSIAGPLRDALNNPANFVQAPAPVAVAYPRLETIGGVNYMLDAPLNPSYAPSATDWVYGHLDGTHIADPSNGALVGMPLRSDDGYPLYYGVGRDAAGKSIAVGPPSVLRNVRIDLTPAQVAANEAEWEAAMRRMAGQT